MWVLVHRDRLQVSLPLNNSSAVRYVKGKLVALALCFQKCYSQNSKEKESSTQRNDNDLVPKHTFIIEGEQYLHVPCIPLYVRTGTCTVLPATRSASPAEFEINLIRYIQNYVA